MNAKTQAVLATYLRAGVAAVIALYPKATEFGRGSK